MQLPILDTLLLGNQFVGIEIFSLNGEEAVAQVLVEKRKGELLIASKEMRSNYDHFLLKPSKNTPVFLTINNSQIIHKEVDGIENVDSKLLYKAFPNLKIDEFFYEIWRLESASIIAICRKNYVEATIKTFTERQISVSGISLGVCALSGVKGFLNETLIKTNNQIISLESTTILNPIDNNKATIYDINGLQVENTYLLPFSSVLQNFIFSSKNTGNVIKYNDDLLAEFKQSSLFTNGLKFIIYSLLIILLINFFAFNYYFKKANETSTTIVANKSLIDDIKSTKERIKNKEEKLGNSSSFSGSRSSLLINEIVKNVPSTVLLNELTFNPFEKKIKEDEKIIFLTDVILVTGISNSSKDLTDWFEQLDKLDWVKSSTIINYGKNDENKTQFTLQLNLNPNEIK